MSDAVPDPSPTRAVREVWTEPAEGPVPPFGITNGVLLALALAADVQLAVAVAGGFDVLLELLVPYAAGLTVAVALLRPRAASGLPFGVAVWPLYAQLLLFFDFWSREAGLYGSLDAFPYHGIRVVAFFAWMFGGLVAAAVVPFTRRHLPLMIVESLPLLVVFALYLGMSL